MSHSDIMKEEKKLQMDICIKKPVTSIVNLLQHLHSYWNATASSNKTDWVSFHSDHKDS